MTVPLPDMFKRVTLAPGRIRINTRSAATNGTPVLLTARLPADPVMWQHVAPVLAKDHMIILTDMRGLRRQRPKPAGVRLTMPMPSERWPRQVLVMRELGFESLPWGARHDRGRTRSHSLAWTTRGRSASSPSLTSAPPARPDVPPTRTSASVRTLVLPRPDGTPPRALDRRRPGRLCARQDEHMAARRSP